MERHEALALLRELVENKVSQPSFVSIRENQNGKFNLILKDDYSSEELKQLAAQKNLLVEVDEKGYCIIRKP